ncbi:DNA repair protein RecN [Desulfuribacillus stibiiarsenatis]|uniref:DNA repair protein RecN n=1 Tax=Desulfuribacillus stibiiarsenatis TaxID=1390249 RepID=A0A1E5L6B0_9FIRM|nr:DNA repair protein RecN [Desulfuribacillus stibiiarsenatis]OEH85675.1 DNA repair protein RecN [Desulfuribacillus stibiiarsenatis]
MLQALSVKNFGLIEEMTISFHHGLHVFTGETGAGKSMIIDALSVVLGGRASNDFIRYGSESATVEALFSVNESYAEQLKLLGIEFGEELDLAVSREIRHGKSICRINGRMFPVHVLKESLATLVDIHGQHEHQKLVDPKQHLDILDAYGKREITELLKNVQKLYQEYNEQKKKLKKLQETDINQSQRLEFLQFQLEELKQVSLQIGEEEQLEAKKKILVNHDKIQKHVQGILSALADVDDRNAVNATSLLSQSIDSLRELVKVDQGFAPHIDCLEIATVQIDEVTRALCSMTNESEENDQDIDQIESRLYQLQQIKRKYRMDIPDLLLHQKNIEQEIFTLLNRDSVIQEVEAQFNITLEQYHEKARTLMLKRKQIAKAMEDNLKNELLQLLLPNVQFEIQFLTHSEPRSHGTDEVEFLFSANVGEPLKPLTKVASGGELSRIMLALKNILAEVDQTPTMIFDEIDTGVSGKAAQKIAEKLVQVSRNRQVFCVTHLAQIAAMSDVHILIKKNNDINKTYTNLDILNEEQIIEELGRMISGEHVTTKTLENAQEMREIAKNTKNKTK